MNPNKPDADKAAEEYAIKVWNPPNPEDFIHTRKAQRTIEDFKAGWQSSQSGKERAALEKYGQHLPNCNINQDWSEAYDAMADTPNKFRDEGYYAALEEIEVKRKKCTCGFEQALSGKQEDQDELWTVISSYYADLAKEDSIVKRVELRKEMQSKFSIITK